MYISIGHEAVIKASELVAIIDHDVYCNCELNKQMKLTPTADDITLQKRLSYTHRNKLNGMFD